MEVIAFATMKKDEKTQQDQRERQRFSERLKKSLIANGYAPRGNVLEREFNLRYYGTPITPHTAGKWLRGESIPRLDKLRTLAIWLNVNLLDLVSKEKLESLEAGEFRRTDKDQLLPYHWEKLAEAQDKALFHQFLTLPEPQKNVVREVIVALAERYNKKQK